MRIWRWLVDGIRCDIAADRVLFKSKWGRWLFWLVSCLSGIGVIAVLVLIVPSTMFIIFVASILCLLVILNIWCSRAIKYISNAESAKSIPQGMLKSMLENK